MTTEKEMEILPLRPQEIDLIKLIREKYRFGTIEVVCKDGVPIDILRTVERTRLDTKG
jgi:hypothetical protein